MAIRSPNGRQLYRSCARVVLLQKSGTRHFSLQPHQPAPGHLLPLSGQHSPVSRERFARYTGRSFFVSWSSFFASPFLSFRILLCFDDEKAADLVARLRRPTRSPNPDDRPGRQTQTTDPVVSTGGDGGAFFFVRNHCLSQISDACFFENRRRVLCLSRAMSF